MYMKEKNLLKLAAIKPEKYCKTRIVGSYYNWRFFKYDNLAKN